MDIEMMLKENHISFKSPQEQPKNFDETNENLCFNHLVKNELNDITILTNSINDTSDSFAKIDFNKIISQYQIPLDIRNDIIYCQKSLINYLKVHQIVITRYGDKIFENAFLKYHLDCLENDIYEINAEQNFFLLRLHKTLEDFLEKEAKNCLIDESITNEHIAKIFATYIQNLNYHCTPSNAKKRIKPQTLLQQFGLCENQKENATESHLSSSQVKNNKKLIPNSINGFNNNNFNNQHQLSLLKPKSEWCSNTKEINFEQTNDSSLSTVPNSSSLESTIEDVNVKSEPNNSSDNVIKQETEMEVKPTQKLGTSVSISNSRMNLLQALNKAKNQTLFSNVNSPQQSQKESEDYSTHKFGILKKKPSLDGNRPIKVEKVQPLEQVKTEISKTTDKVQPVRVVKTRSSDVNKVDKKPSVYSKKDDNTPQCSSSTPSSEESMDYLDLYPHLSKEIPEPSELNQEQFLRYFNLYTDEYSNFLKQRRSKRRRRIVQSNEKKEYHYGNIDPKAISQLQKEKRTKIFLASPPAKRKRIDNSTNDERKKDKVLCIVCLKNGDNGLSKCEFCSKYFHTKCHTGAFSRKPVLIRSRICPPCYKIDPKKIRNLVNATANNSDKQRYTTLMSQAEEFNRKIKFEHSRRESLLIKRKSFKSEMNNIFSLVEKIKNNCNDDDNSKSEQKLDFHSVFLDEIKNNENESSSFHETSGNSSASTDKLKLSSTTDEDIFLNMDDDNDDSLSDGGMVIDEDYDTESK